MKLPRRTPFALSLLLAATPLFAQAEPTEEQSFEVTPEMVAHLWEELDMDNVVFADPLMAAGRDLNANDPMIAPFVRLLDIYTKFVEDNLKGFDGSMSQRDAAFHACNLILVSGVVWPPTMTAAGAGIGAIALSETGPGALGGGVVGGVVGGTAGTGVMCAQILLAVAVALEMNDKYPPVGSRDLGMADGDDLPMFADLEEWIVDDLYANEGEGGSDGDVTERAVNGNKRSRRTRRTARRSQYAGQWESLFIHLVRETASPQVSRLARYWQNYPGLSRSNKRKLEQFAGLRPLVEQMAYMSANGKLSSKSLPAMPLTGWQKTVSKLLQADKATVQRLWLDCFAIGNTRLSVSNDKLSWATPRALRAVGARSSYSAGISPVKARVTGFGGSLAASVEAGKFTIKLGNAGIRGDRIRVGFSIGKGRLLDVTVKGQLGPAKHQFRVSPRLTRNLTGYLEFGVKGYGLELKKVSVGRLKLSLGLPKLPPALQPIAGLVKKIESKIKSAAKEVIGKKLRFDRVFGDLGKHVPKKLLEVLNKTADDFGMAKVTRLSGLSLKNGKLQAQVRGVEWNRVPKLDSTIRKFGSRVKQLSR